MRDGRVPETWSRAPGVGLPARTDDRDRQRLPSRRGGGAHQRPLRRPGPRHGIPHGHRGRGHHRAGAEVSLAAGEGPLQAAADLSQAGQQAVRVPYQLQHRQVHHRQQHPQSNQPRLQRVLKLCKNKKNKKNFLFLSFHSYRDKKNSYRDKKKLLQKNE